MRTEHPAKWSAPSISTLGGKKCCSYSYGNGVYLEWQADQLVSSFILCKTDAEAVFSRRFRVISAQNHLGSEQTKP